MWLALAFSNIFYPLAGSSVCLKTEVKAVSLLGNVTYDYV
jgi:hypothetical protein